MKKSTEKLLLAGILVSAVIALWAKSAEALPPPAEPK